MKLQNHCVKFQGFFLLFSRNVTLWAKFMAAIPCFSSTLLLSAKLFVETLSSRAESIRRANVQDDPVYP